MHAEGGRTARCLGCHCVRTGEKPWVGHFSCRVGKAAGVTELGCLKRVGVTQPAYQIQSIFAQEKWPGWIYLFMYFPPTHLAGVQADAVAEQEGKSKATEKQGRRLKQPGMALVQH